MRKAKVAAVTIGLLVSVFGAGTMVTDASTVRLDDSVTNAPEATRTTTASNRTTAAATTTSIKTTPTGKKTNAIRQHNRKLATAPEQEISADEFWRVPTAQETNPVENAENTEITENQAIIIEETETEETESELNEIIEETAENPEIAESAQTEEASRIFVKSVPSFKHKAKPKKDRNPAKSAETSVAVTDPVEPVEAPTERVETTEPIIITKPTEAPVEPVEAPTETAETTEPVIITKPTEAPVESVESPTEPVETTEIITKPAEAPVEPVEAPTETVEPTEPVIMIKSTEAPVEPITDPVEEPVPSTTEHTTAKATTKATTTTTTTTSTSTSTSTTTETTSTTPEPVITTIEETVPMQSPEIVDVSEMNLENILDYVQEIPQEDTAPVIEEIPQEDTAPIIEEIEEIIPEQPEQVEEPIFDFEIADVLTEEPTVIAVSDSDYVLLCNAVAHEAGSDNITIENKAKVVEVIMNRVDSPSFPNTVYGVITQKSQFSGSSSYANLSSYTSKVTQNVKSAVDLYFEDPSAFDHGYLYFYGDGSQNHFSQY